MKKFKFAIEMLVLSVIFTVMTLTINVAAIGPQGSKVGLSSLNNAMRNLIGVNMTFYKISDILGYMALAVAAMFAVIGVIQLIRRKSLVKIDKTILCLGGLYVVTLALYVIFDKLALNYRPIIMPGETSLEASYPSSHTMLALAVFGSAAMVVSEYIASEGLAKLLKWVCIILMVATVAFRLLSGVHWFTDIIASVFIGATLLAFFSAARSSLNGRERES